SQQAIGMRILHIPLDAFGTKHPAIKGKLLPRLESDDFLAANLELDPALLAAKTAVRLHEAVGWVPGFLLPAPLRRVLQMRTVLPDQRFDRRRRFSHATSPSSAVAPLRASFAYRQGTAPATSRRNPAGSNQTPVGKALASGRQCGCE